MVIYRLDRITQSLMDWVKLAETLKRHNVSPSPISERLHDAKAAKRRRGLRCAGLVPYGFVAAPATRQLTPVPAECELIRQMFESVAAGATSTTIAGWLNEQGVTTKKTGKVGGRPWTEAT